MSQFDVSVEGSSAVVRMTDTPSERDARAMLALLRNKADEASLKGALFEVHTSAGLAPAQILGIVKDLAALGFSPAFRFAVIADPAAREAVQFAETAAINRGWQVRIFATREEAMAWLQGAPG